jgi:hypothetical protein
MTPCFYNGIFPLGRGVLNIVPEFREILANLSLRDPRCQTETEYKQKDEK